ncbi:hypothetical protein CEXT_696171, partial [Caerostris extrusa]
GGSIVVSRCLAPPQKPRSTRRRRLVTVVTRYCRTRPTAAKWQ